MTDAFVLNKMTNHLKRSVLFVLRIFFASIIFSNLLQVTSYKNFIPYKRRHGNGTLTAIDNRTSDLFKILDDLPQNELFRTMSCGIMEQELPDFRAPNRRVSEVKCLEHLWKMRFYDQLLLKKIRCKTGVEGAYVSFAIYRGKEVSTGKFAHTGAIGWQTDGEAWIFLCGAVMISDRFFLTAAHCSTANDTRVMNPSPKIIRLGDKYILDSVEFGKTPTDVYIKNVIVPDNYRPPSKYYDIALIELEDIIPFKVFTNPSCIWPYEGDELFGKGYESGWGVVESDSKHQPEYQIDDVEVIDTNVCSEKLNEALHVNTIQLPHQICSNYCNVNDTCKGDSGGPLMMPIINPYYTDFTVHYIVGIQSTSFGCDSPDNPNVYTKVSSFVNWIEDIVWPEDHYVNEILSEKQFAKIYEGL
ncbi:PREDICTED: tryptase gamma-like [Papilio polytes]|uniref:tryptase gamma-like n=1 Tax=Papilio polytes TaxID=76194 RepID=UPI0006763DA0|nr:PREDICTED: tryptase gamma-like [Papilio polytes]